jgi:hypothetical protein
MKNLRNADSVKRNALVAVLAAVHKAAGEASAAGLCVLPPAEDGSKRPLPNKNGKWEIYKTNRSTSEELRRWYPGRSGLGIVTGTVSGHLGPSEKKRSAIPTTRRKR